MKMLNNIIQLITEKLETKEEISPFLFLWTQIDKVNTDILNLSLELCEKLWINKNFLFKFENPEWKIKVKDIKQFLEKVFVTPTFKAQVFIIENISKMTEESANSCLKVFEEPPFWNIIFLTSESESSILDTILSRCTIINLKQENIFEINQLYYSMIDDYIRNINYDLASYVFKEKLEKENYINLLKNLIIYLKEKLIFLDLVEQINEDINWIQKNNLLPKYVVDKYIIKIKSY